jgi:hypothetical protein
MIIKGVKEIHSGMRRPTYKNRIDNYPQGPVLDNFPLAAGAKSPDALPRIPAWNAPPKQHVPEKTPLFIGFTRNWPILQQAVVSYITAGWPPSDIYVVENTGTMDANQQGQLSFQNPFYIDYRRLTEIFGVNVIRTPTYLSFAQLQNFFLSEAITQNYSAYFWSHMDVVAMSDEETPSLSPDSTAHKSLYLRAVGVLRERLSLSYMPPGNKWAIVFFAYDHLALVHTRAYIDVGGWDTMIPYYMTDCDMHSRLRMAGWETSDAHVGSVYDIADSLPDLLALYRTTGEGNAAPQTGDAVYKNLRDECDELQRIKNENKDGKGRNTWQGLQRGGQGEPWYKDPEGFEDALWMAVEFGKTVYAEKWGHRDCDLEDVGLRLGDEWKVEKDW